MNKTVILASLVLCAGVLAAQPPPPGGRGRGGPGFRPEFGAMSAWPASRTPVTGAPYSAAQTTQFQQTLAGGNQISRQEQSKVFRDSAGRVRTERTFTPAGSTTAQTRITIFDPVGGYSYGLDPAKLTAVKTAQPPAPSGQAGQGGHGRGPGAGTAQVQTENLGTQVVNGVPATGTRTTQTIPAGAIGNSQPIQVVREVWVSADLKVPVMIKATDPRFGNTVMQLTNIVPAEPDPSLFQVPSNYTVSSRAAGGRGFAGSDRPMRRKPQ